jgi:16S rRNA (cytidine1402-2'-O)-methyltransferase
MELAFGSRRPCFLGRELTKLHEEHLAGTLSEVRMRLGKRKQVRGEITLVVEGAKEGPPGDTDEPDAAEIAAQVDRTARKRKLTRKEAVREVAEELGLSRNRVYRAVLDQRKG